MDIVVVGTVAVLVLGLVAWVGTRVLLSGSRRGSGMHNALGNFIDVFDPARSRAEEDLKSREHSGPVIPSPDDDDLPVIVDLDAGRAKIRRPHKTD